MKIKNPRPKGKIFSLVLIILFFTSATLVAAATQVASYKINGKEESAKFNPSRGDVVNLEINAIVPVKFNTIAVCGTDDSVCSRTTAVKYFTQTDFGLSVVKEWDGKTSKGVIVADGDYKIKVTMKDESEQENIQELSPYLITIDSNFSGGSDENSSSSSSQAQSSSASSQTTGGSSVGSGTYSYSISTHLSPEDLSANAKSSKTFEVSAGRERLAYVGVPVAFAAEYSASNLSQTETVKFVWSFGDGATGEGKKVSHTYKFPGDYIVVVNSAFSQMSAVSRTNVKVLPATVFVSRAGADFAEITNGGKFEINLGGWAIGNGSQKFILPQDTIIGPRNKITFSSDYIKLNFNKQNDAAILENPSFGEVSRLLVSASQNYSPAFENGSFPSDLDNDPVVAKIRDFIKNGNKNALSANSPRVLSAAKAKNEASSQSVVATAKDKKSDNADVKNNDSFSEFKEATSVAATAEAGPKTGGFFKNIIYLPVRGFNFIARTFYGGN